jgi:[FeFe] hydrogenase (group B1/B3)
MKKFDTKVQYIKYRVLREVAKLAWEDNLAGGVMDIPEKIIPGKTPTMRCCVYKERAILVRRIKLAMGVGDNIINVIDIACDDCPMSGYEITRACRGCLAHRCESVCPRGAISSDENRVAHINKDKCVECGLCARECPYGAILKFERPCMQACKPKALSVGSDHSIVINPDKCVSCGACVYQCPWGAITDKSFILDAIKILKNETKVFAVVAPSIASQFTYAKLGQVASAIKALGFFSVVEAALGADMAALAESKELSEQGRLCSSCCPAFVDYIRKNHPELTPKVSKSLSPAAMISKYIKENNPDCKVVFIGPCTAKKAEYEHLEYIDCAITFEELQALFDSRDIELSSLEESVLDNASYYGRIFARCGGLSSAISQGLKEQGLDFDFKPLVCNGIAECKTALAKMAKGAVDNNFIEGMACVGGCIGGAGCLTHGAKSALNVDKYGRQATESAIKGAVGALNALTSSSRSSETPNFTPNKIR